MKALTVRAPAKLNLTLDILGLRPDGYHELSMLMQAVSLCDTVTVRQGTGGAWSLCCEDDAGRPVPGIPCDARNLAWRAAECYFAHTALADDGIEIHIVKRIPVQAGLAGGSADAAAVLLALSRLNGDCLSQRALCALAAKVGSDVPFCVMGGTAMVHGRGEAVLSEAIGMVQHYVICKPPFGISTPKLFALSDRQPATRRPDASRLLDCLRAGDSSGAGSLLCNVLEPVAVTEHPIILEIKQALRHAGACGAQMTGSGSAVFGLFPDEAAAKAAAARMRASEYEVFYARSE